VKYPSIPEADIAASPESLDRFFRLRGPLSRFFSLLLDFSSRFVDDILGVGHARLTAAHARSRHALDIR
jgi:hypothetical protein